MTPQFEKFVLEGTLPDPKAPNQTLTVHFNFFRDAEREGIKVQYWHMFGQSGTSASLLTYGIFLPRETLDSIGSYQGANLIKGDTAVFRHTELYWLKAEDARAVWTALVFGGFSRFEP